MFNDYRYHLEEKLNISPYRVSDILGSDPLYIWVTKEHEILEIKTMKTEHIVNCMRMLKRQCDDRSDWIFKIRPSFWWLGFELYKRGFR